MLIRAELLIKFRAHCYTVMGMRNNVQHAVVRGYCSVRRQRIYQLTCMSMEERAGWFQNKIKHYFITFERR